MIPAFIPTMADGVTPAPVPLDAYHPSGANAEGWGVFASGTDEDGGWQLEVRRVGCCRGGRPRFADDAAALRHVRRRARQGSALHQGALRLLEPLEAIAVG